jgi:Protein of unknown function (DUF4435)
MRAQDYTYENKIDELRLEIRHPNNRGKVFILVEGESDVKLYRKFYDVSKIERIPGGNTKVIDALNLFCTLSNSFIGIRDADFMNVLDQTNTTQNLFLTDVHDLEMLICANDEVFSSILNELCPMVLANHRQLKTQLLKSLRFISYCRLYNELANLELTFKNVGFGDLFNPTTFEIDKTAFVEKLLEQSPNTRLTDVATIIDEAENLENPNHDLLQLCNGHDFIKVMALYISSQRNKGVSSELITSHFRTAYHLSHFKGTQLYAQTNNWATQNNCVLSNL